MNSVTCNLNKGSITVEMCLVMPLVLVVVFNMIMVIMNLINQSVIQGNSYVSLYSYSEESDAIFNEAYLEQTIDERLVLNSADCDTQIEISDEEVNVNIVNVDKVNSLNNVSYKTEEGKGTTRLRRWQLYGDVLQE